MHGFLNERERRKKTFIDQLVDDVDRLVNFNIMYPETGYV